VPWVLPTFQCTVKEVVSEGVFKKKGDVAYIWEVASIMFLLHLVQEELGLVSSPDSPKEPLLMIEEGLGEPLHHGVAILSRGSIIPEGLTLLLHRGGGGGCSGRFAGARGILLILGHSE
jgi:hypothetical protein